MKSQLHFLMLLPLLFILITTSIITAQPSPNRYNTRITSNQLFVYTFTEGQTSPNETHSHDVIGQSSFGDMLLNTDSSKWSMKNIGVKFDGTGDQTRAISENNSTSLINRISVTQSWTFESWFVVGDWNQGGMIAGIGLWQPGAVDTVCSSPQGTTSLSIFQEGSTFAMYALGGSPSLPFCSKPGAYVGTPTINPIHVVGTSDGTMVSLYVNGVFQSATKMYNAYYRWNPAARLYLAQQKSSVAESATTWKGEIMMVAMYDRALSQAEITTNYNAGLPNSKPIGVIIGTTTALQNQLTVFSNLSLSSYDYNNDSCTLYLSALPTIGDLYLYDTTTNTTTLVLQSQLPLRISPATRFAYRPPPNAWGPRFTYFQYYANDATASGYRTNVYIDVLLVPQSPIVTNANFTLYPTYHINIDLDGYNFNDLNDRSADAAIITTLPVNGSLFASADGVNSLNKITTEMLPYRIERIKGHRWVMYFANDYILKQHSGMEVLWTDIFNFRVANQNWTSVPEAPGIITLRVLNPFTVQDLSTSVAEGAPALSINLAALTKVNSEKSEKFVLVSVPQYGQLSFPGASRPPEPGMNLGGAQLIYKINPVINYQHHTRDSFTYQLQFADGFTSVMGTVYFNIQPLRQAPILTSSYNNNTIEFAGDLDSMMTVRHNLTLVPFSDPLMEDPSRQYTVSILSLNFFTVRLNPSLGLSVTSNALDTSFTANMSMVSAALTLFQVQAGIASKQEIAIPITISEASAAAKGLLSSDIRILIRQKQISASTQLQSDNNKSFIEQNLYVVLGLGFGGLALCVVFILILRRRMMKREKQRQEMRQIVKSHEQETNDEPEETDGTTKPKRKKLKQSPQKPLRSKKRIGTSPVTTLGADETDGVVVKRKVNRQLFTSSTNPGPEGEIQPAASTPRGRTNHKSSAATAFAQHCQARLGVELTEYHDDDTYNNPLHDTSEWDVDDVRLQVNDRITSTASTINDSPPRGNTSTYPTAHDSSRHNSWDSESSTGAFTATNTTTPSKYTTSSSRYTTTPSRHHTTTPSRHTTTPSRYTHHAVPGGVSQESYMPHTSSTAPASYIPPPPPRRSPSNLSSATAPAAPTMSYPVTPPRRAQPSPVMSDASASVPLAPPMNPPFSAPRRVPLREPPADPTGTPHAG